ncbi:hypothetical protein K2X30_04905 [bacterium]|nr:hypothetical protein [bacterium]
MKLLMTPIEKIGIVYAMDTEAEPLIHALSLKPLASPDTDLPGQLYHGTLGKLEIRLAVAGRDSRFNIQNIGTNAAVLTTYQLLKDFKPSILINPGTAGGFQGKKARIGDVYLCTNGVCFHDRRVPLEEFRKSMLGFYPVIQTPRLASELHFKTGRVSTGNSLDCTDMDLTHLQLNQADVKDMEAAAIAWVAWVKKVPFLPVKAVTDFVESHESAAEQFLANFFVACSYLTTSMVAILDFMENKKVEEL